MDMQTEGKYKLSQYTDLLEYTGQGVLPSERTRCSMCIQFDDFFYNWFTECAYVCVLQEGARVRHSTHVEVRGQSIAISPPLICRRDQSQVVGFGNRHLHLLIRLTGS